MNEAEKERLIKKDLESIENRVSHAFNQGYEMGLKESRSKNPNTCGDAISRKAVLDLAEWFDINPQHFIVANLIDEVENMPSVSPQQRTGRWIQKEEEGEAEPFIIWECSECHCVDGKPSYKYCPQCGAKMQEEDQ